MTGRAAAVGSRIAYGPQDRIRVGKVAYICAETDERGHRLRRVDDPEMYEAFSHEEMARIERSPGYRYDRDWFNVGKVRARERSGVEALHEIPPREQPKILWKYEYCDGYRRMRLNGAADGTNEGMTRAIAVIAQRINGLECAKVVRRVNERRTKGSPVPTRKDGTPRKVRSGTEVSVREPPSYRTLQRWLAVLEECDWCATALRYNYRLCGDRTSRIEPEAHDAMCEAARGYASQARPTLAMQYERLEGAIRALNTERASMGLPPLGTPSRRRFRAEVRALDAFWTYARRHTLDAAKLKFAGVEDGPTATRVGERIEVDEWQVSLQTLVVRAGVWRHLDADARASIRRARWWAYVAIDCASRAVLAMRLVETPRAAEAVAVVRMILEDKSSYARAADALTDWSMSTGIGTFVADWGSAFRADETRRAVRAMGATFDHPPAGHPQLRGKVERMFSTLETRFLSRFTGRTFSNVVAKGDYDAEAAASVPLDVLAHSLVRHVVDDYHNRPHLGLGGETPRAAWERLVASTGRIPVPDKETIRGIFGVEETCALDPSGVTYAGLRYQSRELHAHFTAVGPSQVAVRVDPEDVGAASVRLGEDWLTVPCRNPGLEGVPLRTWLNAAGDLRARYTEHAALTRDVVLAAVRDLDGVAEECRREAGIAEELVTPDALEAARVRLGLGFALPPWDGASDGLDLLDGVIVTGGAKDVPVAAPASPASPAWRISDRAEKR